MIAVSEELNFDFGVDTIKIPPNTRLQSAVCAHADMNMCVIDNKVFVEKDCAFLDKLKGKEVIMIEEALSQSYPKDVLLNCLSFGDYILCNPLTVSKTILEYCKSKTIISVPQGYTRCSTLQVDDKSFLTADNMIAKKLTDSGFDVLKIREGYIEIQDYKYGFIGGAGGKVGDTLYFFGDITAHPDYEKIEKFLASKEIKYKYFNYPLYDFGGIYQL